LIFFFFFINEITCQTTPRHHPHKHCRTHEEDDDDAIEEVDYF